jgi:acetolactate synthase I/II/III large subunit
VFGRTGDCQAHTGGNIVCVVLNDTALSLIDIKQQRQQRQSIGVRYPRTDFATVAKGMGCHGWRGAPGDAPEGVLADAFAQDGVSVVDVQIDPSGYAVQPKAFRG